MGNGFSLVNFPSKGEFRIMFIFKVFEKYIKYEILNSAPLLVLYKEIKQTRASVHPSNLTSQTLLSV